MNNRNNLILPAIILGGTAVALTVANRNSKTTLDSLAYDIQLSTNKESCRVYLPENNQFIPYLVLTNHYSDDNRTLLIREEPLHIPLQFGENSDYDDSEIDHYLENLYLPSLGWEAHVSMKEVSLLQTSADQPQLRREAFILTAEEMGFTDQLESILTLDYFKMEEHRHTTLNRIPVELWTRTPGQEPSDAVVITCNGERSADCARTHHYIRPAICMENNTPIYTRSDIFPGVKIRTVSAKKGYYRHAGK